MEDDSDYDQELASTGKRIFSNLSKYNISASVLFRRRIHERDSAGFCDDPLNMTPFSQDNLGSMMLDTSGKYKNVIKRYWTEKEVSFYLFLSESLTLS